MEKRNLRIGKPGSSHQRIVVGVRANPEPDEIATLLDRKGTIPQSDAHGLEASGLLEVQRWMVRVSPEAREAAIRQFANLSRKRLIGQPENWQSASYFAGAAGTKVLDRCLGQPVSRPAQASPSIFLSNRSASEASNQDRNASSSSGDKRLTAASISSMRVVRP
jgi:hypothetical protein